MLEFYKDKKVFITGHTGFKGSWLTKILVMAGAKVCGYSLEPKTKPNLFELLNLKNDIKSIIGDSRDFEKLKNAIDDFKPDIVFHLAAQPIVKEAYDNPAYTFEVNMMGTVNILEAVRTCDSIKSFVNVTTDKVYLNNEWEWGYRENETLCGKDPYSCSKACSELITYAYCKSYFDKNPNISVSTARSGNVIGGGDFSPYRIIPDCVRSAINHEDIIIRNPYSIRPYQHVLDCLNGYLILAMKQYNNKAVSGNYNFGPKEESCVTTGKLATIFCEKWHGVKWTDTKESIEINEEKYLKLDCSRSKEKLNWEARLSIEEAINLVVEWSKAYEKNNDICEISEKQIKEFFL